MQRFRRITIALTIFMLLKSAEHTATTTYPCCISALGRFCRSWSSGTGRKDTAKCRNFLKELKGKFQRK